MRMNAADVEDLSLTAGLIIIGNEILSGHTLDTNSNWLCRQLTMMGIEVRRIVTVPDFGSDVVEVIQDAVTREWDIVITSGGLGPTYDDGTVFSIARALNRDVHLHPRAIELVKQRYADLAEKGLVPDNFLTPSRIKMALLPEGAYPLRNDVGTAPGVYLKISRTHLPFQHWFSLPGVPRELKSIFLHQVLPILGIIFQLGAYHEIRCNVGTMVESDLAPYLKEVARRHPRVYVKSTPQGHAKNQKSGMIVIFSARGRDSESLREMVLRARDDLLTSLNLDSSQVKCDEFSKDSKYR